MGLGGVGEGGGLKTWPSDFPGFLSKQVAKREIWQVRILLSGNHVFKEDLPSNSPT